MACQNVLVIFSSLVEILLNQFDTIIKARKNAISTTHSAQGYLLFLFLLLQLFIFGQQESHSKNQDLFKICLCCHRDGKTIYIELAKHHQTILAYEMNGEPLSVPHGSPLRLRIETQLRFKMVKWLKSIEFVTDYTNFGM